MTEKKETQPPAGKNRLDLHYKDFADRIISQIKAGTAPWQKPWKPGRLVVPQRLDTRVSDRKEPVGPEDE